MDQIINKLSDAELLARATAARGSAHRAPLSEVTDVNKHGKPTGERFITQYTYAWATHAGNWRDLALECTRRGLVIPPCDCSPEMHERS